MFIVLFLVIALFIFLFTFYYYAKDDFYFIRKGILMDEMFNIVFIGLFFSIFMGRLVYVMFHLSTKFVNPLVFFLIPYFPGLSLFGSIVGLFFSIVLLTKRRKIHGARFLDYTSIALLSALPVIFLFVYKDLYLTVIHTVLFIFFTKSLLPKFHKGSLKEGSISLLFLIMFALAVLLQAIIQLYQKNIFLEIEDFLFILLFFVSALLLIRLEIKRPMRTS